jgi:K+-sensing histidine kinase KdpD
MANPVALGSTQLPRNIRTIAQYLAACVAIILLTYGGFVLQINLLTISFLYFLVVVIVASRFGFWTASFTSVLAVLLLDYYFEPPLFSLEVENPGIFVALVTFEVTALAISRLHGRGVRVAREAAINRAEMEQL